MSGTRSFGSTLNDAVTGVGTDSGSSVYATGYFSGAVDLDPEAGTDIHTSNGGTDVFLVKLTTGGQKSWSRTFGGLGNDQPTGLTTNSVGDVAIGGFFEHTVTFNAQNGTDAFTSAGGQDGFVTLFNPIGTYLWTRTFGGTGQDSVNAVAFDADNNVFAAGQFTGTVNFKASTSGTDARTAAGLSDAFVVKITNAGGFGLAATAGGTGNDAANAVTVSLATTFVYWGGAFQNTADLDPRSTTENHVSFGGNDCFIIKMLSNGDWVRTLSSIQPGKDRNRRRKRNGRIERPDTCTGEFLRFRGLRGRRNWRGTYPHAPPAGDHQP